MINRTANPTTYLATLTQVKASLGIEYSDDDTRLTDLLEAASDHIEKESDRVFRACTYTHTFSSFGSYIILKKHPVSSITITYYDEDNEQQTLSSDDYYLLKNQYQCEIYPVDSFPSVYSRPEAITCTMTFAEDVPSIARQACLHLVAKLDRHRGDDESKPDADYERMIKSLRGGGYLI